jgi:sugar phosphate permease
MRDVNPSANDGQSSNRVSARQIHVAATSFFALFSIVGLALYGLPFFYDFFVTDYGWSRGTVTSGNAISKLIVGPLFGFVIGWIVDRFGPRRMMISGILMAGIALVGLSLTTSLWAFYVFYLFNALAYVAGGPLPNQVLISRWFDKARGRAMGFAYVGIAVGGTVVPLLAHWLIQSFGWTIALRTIGFLIVLIALPLALFIKDNPEGREGPAGPSQPVVSIKSILTNRYFYLLAIGSMCSIAAVGGTNQNLKLYLSLDQGISQQQVAGLISLLMASSIAGRLLMGWLADRFHRKYVMLLIYALVAAAIPLLFVIDRPGMPYLFAVVFGIGLGGDYMIIPLMAGDLFGVRVLGRVMGIILTADGVAEATAPWLVAHLRDISGSYDPGFLLLIALAVLGAVAVAFLPRSRQEGRVDTPPSGQEAEVVTV